MIAITKKLEQIQKEQKKSDELLGKLLPKHILPSLKNKEVTIHDNFNTIYAIFNIKQF